MHVCDVNSRFRFVCTVVILVFSQFDVSQAADQVVREHAGRPDAEPLKYWLYLPDGYDESETNSNGWPLILFLHGGGEGGQDMERVKRYGPPKLIDGGKEFPCIVVSPRNPSKTQFWDDQQLASLLDELAGSLRIDARRIYLTGLSRGAYGSWRLAVQNPDRFAALVPISGGGPLPYMGRIKDIPVWAFHGAKDPVIPADESRRLIKELNRLGGSARLTVYRDAEHDAWTEAYSDPELYKWLFQQSR